MAKRGQLTPTVQAAALRLLGREITSQEVETMPDVQKMIVFDLPFHEILLSSMDEAVIHQWRSYGYVEKIGARLRCGRYFWDAMSELLWLAYADHENQPD